VGLREELALDACFGMNSKNDVSHMGTIHTLQSNQESTLSDAPKQARIPPIECPCDRGDYAVTQKGSGAYQTPEPTTTLYTNQRRLSLLQISLTYQDIYLS
jgi:hypothetical protein